MKRMGLIFRAKANKALDRAEDPRETLDYSYQRQLDLLSKVRRVFGTDAVDGRSTLRLCLRNVWVDLEAAVEAMGATDDTGAQPVLRLGHSQSSTMSTNTRRCSLTAAALTTARNAMAVRPPRPITLP